MNRRIATSLLLPLAAGFAFAAGKTITDDTLYDDVRRKLASDPIVKGGRLEVDVKNGVVTLKGKIEQQKQKERAEKLAKGVKGVKSVVNQIQVSPEP